MGIVTQCFIGEFQSISFQDEVSQTEERYLVKILSQIQVDDYDRIVDPPSQREGYIGVATDVCAE